MEQKAALMFASNQSRYLPRWHRHEALYEAYRSPAADHGELVREILAFAGTERLATGEYLVGLLLPLGAYDLVPDLWMLWGEDNRRYRQSPQFKRYIRESGVFDYWRDPPESDPPAPALIAALLDGAALPGLRELNLAEFSCQPEFIRALVSAPGFARLRRLGFASLYRYDDLHGTQQ